MAVQMVTIGEEIGELSNMFKRLNVFYQEYVDTFLTRFTTMFEPIMLIFMGVIIGLMVIGMFLPIFKIATLGIVGDYKVIVPKMLEKFKSKLNK
jgi:type IV pilus assembly protein PilC